MNKISVTFYLKLHNEIHLRSKVQYYTLVFWFDFPSGYTWLTKCETIRKSDLHSITSSSPTFKTESEQ